jgi:RNA polymerase sigma-70 factor (ECF subfamily)
MASRADAPATDPPDAPSPGGAEAVDRHDALTAIVAEHGERVVRVVYGMVGDVQTAEDLAQDAFVRAYERWDQLQDASRAVGWVYAIAVNNARQHLRGRSRWLHLPFGDRALGRSAQVTADDDAGGAWAVLSRLDPVDREPLVMIGIGELTVPEAAAALGISVAATHKRWQRARARFRQALEAE